MPRRRRPHHVQPPFLGAPVLVLFSVGKLEVRAWMPQPWPASPRHAEPPCHAHPDLTCVTQGPRVLLRALEFRAGTFDLHHLVHQCNHQDVALQMPLRSHQPRVALLEHLVEAVKVEGPFSRRRFTTAPTGPGPVRASGSGNTKGSPRRHASSAASIRALRPRRLQSMDSCIMSSTAVSGVLAAPVGGAGAAQRDRVRRCSGMHGSGAARAALATAGKGLRPTRPRRDSSSICLLEQRVPGDTCLRCSSKIFTVSREFATPRVCISEKHAPQPQHTPTRVFSCCAPEKLSPTSPTNTAHPTSAARRTAR